MIKVMLGIAIGAILFAAPGRARPAVPPPLFKAVRAHWKTRTERVKAFDVAYCESRYSVYASNGQYLGVWQFGSWARQTYGFGWDVWSQTRAAYRYYRAAGWSGWSCA